MRIKLYLIGLLLFSFSSFAAMELDGSYGYKKQVFGDHRQNKSVETSYSGGLAWYLLRYTAIEFNYFYSEAITTQNDVLRYDADISVTKIVTTVKTRVTGLGIRQALSSKKSRIRPLISAGYARQVQQDGKDITFRSDTTGEEIIVSDTIDTTKSHSIFATFALQLILTKRFALKGSVKSIFPAFEFDKAKDNLKYTAGFTWFF